jgi:hypothetical protein
MLVTVVLVGLLVLVALAVVIGTAESRGLNMAWKRVALARKEDQERARGLLDREAALEQREMELRRREERRYRRNDDRPHDG